MNESICREKHIPPLVKQILAQLGNSTVFTNLDANVGFWQIKLPQESSPLTTLLRRMEDFDLTDSPLG